MNLNSLNFINIHKISKLLPLDSVNSAGGVLLGWNDNLFECLQTFVGIFSIFGVFRVRSYSLIFLFTIEYFPIDREDKKIVGGRLKTFVALILIPGSYVEILMSLSLLMRGVVEVVPLEI